MHAERMRAARSALELLQGAEALKLARAYRVRISVAHH